MKTIDKHIPTFLQSEDLSYIERVNQLTYSFATFVHQLNDEAKEYWDHAKEGDAPFPIVHTRFTVGSIVQIVIHSNQTYEAHFDLDRMDDEFYLDDKIGTLIMSY